MYFKEIIDEFNCGKKIRRASWPIGIMIDRNNDRGVNIKDLLADDWEVIETKKEKTWWKPKRGERYFVVNATGFTKENYPYVADGTDELHIKFGNYFQTEEQAEFMVEKLKVIHDLEKFSYENNEEEIDWNNEDQRKFFLYYSYSANQVLVYYVISMKEIPFNVYFTSQELAEKAIITIGAERIKKYYFGTKEE